MVVAGLGRPPGLLGDDGRCGGQACLREEEWGPRPPLSVGPGVGVGALRELEGEVYAVEHVGAGACAVKGEGADQVSDD